MGVDTTIMTDTARPWKKIIFGTAGTFAALALLVVLMGSRADDAGAALTNIPVLSLLLLVGAGVIPMLLRAEAFRVSLRAGGAHARRGDVHTASGLTFCAAEVNHYAARLVRAGSLKRLGCRNVTLWQLLAAEIPVLLVEAFIMAVVVSVAVLFLGWPWWIMLIIPAVALAVAGVIRFVHGRWGHTAIGRGLSALTCPRLTGKLVLIGLLVLAVQIVRTYLAMRAVGIELGVDEAALAFVCVAGLGTLPLGPSAAPTVSLALFSSGSGTVAAAAGGLALTATAAIAAVVYALIALLLFGALKLWTRMRPVTPNLGTPR
jgi:hypothetical protein